MHSKRETSATLAPTLWAILLCFAAGSFLTYAAAPGWWSARDATNSSLGTNDYAVATQGQLKQFTARAADELNAELTNGGAGPDLSNLVYGWQQDYLTNGYATNTANPTRPYKPADFQAVTIGQLKYIASLVDAQLASNGYTGFTPPWLQVNPATDNTAALVGQIKEVFDFDLSIAPAPVTSLAVSNSDPGGLDLTWALPIPNNGNAITIKQSLDGGATYTLIATIDPGSTSYVVTGLPVGTDGALFEVTLSNPNGGTPATSSPSPPVVPPTRYVVIDLGTNFTPVAISSPGVLVGNSGGLPAVYDLNTMNAPATLSTNIGYGLTGLTYEAVGIDDAGHIAGNVTINQSTTNFPYYEAGCYWSDYVADPVPLGQMVTNTINTSSAITPMASVVRGVSGPGFIVGFSDSPNWPVVFDPSWIVNGSNFGHALATDNNVLGNWMNATSPAIGAGGMTNWCGYFNGNISGTNYASGPVINGITFTNYPTLYPYAINASNIVVGGAGTSAVEMVPGSGGSYSTNNLGPGGAVALNNLLTTNVVAGVTNVTATPQIVGLDGTGTNAMLWDYTDYMGNATNVNVAKNLNLLIPGNLGTNVPPWHLQNMVSINDAGVIVGTGTYASTSRSMISRHPHILADPPPPVEHATALVSVQIERKIDNDVGDTTPNTYNPISVSNNQLLPGQQVNLQLTAPPGVTVSNIQWVIPDHSFKDYVIASDQSSAAAPTQLQPSDLQNQNITFYWSDSGVKQVTCNFTVYGVNKSQTVNLTVVPVRAALNREMKTTISDNAVITLNSATAPGIAWKFSVALPPNFDSHKSQCGLIQLVNLSGIVTVINPATPQQLAAIPAGPNTTIVAGGIYKLQYSGLQSLDTEFPYESLYFDCDGRNVTSLSDAPALGSTGPVSSSLFSRVTVSPNETFRTFLTLFPEGANSKPIPLNFVDWNWGGSLDVVPVYNLNTPSQFAGPAHVWNPTVPFPAWAQLVKKPLLFINN